MADRLEPRLTQNEDNNLDLLLEDGLFQWAEDGTQTAQHGAVRLSIIYGEWKFNTTLGFKLYEVIFDQQKSIAEKEFEIKRVILGTPGVVKIITFLWAQVGNEVTVNGQVQTQWGAEEIGLVITPL